jgi:hypothetical protein
MKCPACEVEINDSDERGQVWHMEKCHPEVLEQRWKAAGLSSGEIIVLKGNIRERLPIFSQLCAECRDKNWDLIYKLDKDGHSVKLSKGSPPTEIIEICRVDTSNVDVIHALCLAMDIATFRKWD